MSILRAFLPFAALLLVPRLAAQEVAGELRDRAGAPIRAARVVLLDSAGTRLSSGLTDAAGAFRLRAAADGRYRVRADRVGYAGTTSAWLTLRAGEATPLRLVANPTAVTLEGITARAGSRCGAASPATAVLWEEAGKALAAAEEAVRSEALRYRIVTYRRELDSGAQAILSETRQTTTGSAGTPFSSTPLDTLLGRGFVRAAGDSVLWDAPDGPVLLARPFVNTHCFHVVAHEDSAGLVGLGFRPAGGRRLPDVAGTLWLDRATARLRYLEYRYVNVGPLGRNPRVGGRVEFEVLPTGHWVVRRWWIRMPTAGPEEIFPESGPRPRLVREFRRRSLVEVGGEVTGAGDHLISAGETPARIAGVVWDSLRGRPLAEARVSAVGTAWSAVADSMGAFVLGPVPPGTYTVSFSHPVLTALGEPNPPVTVTLPADSGRALALSLPPAERVAAAHCPTLPTGRGVLVGRAASAGQPASDAEVTVGWRSLSRERRGANEQRLSTRSAEDGSFVICDIPIDLTLQISVRWNGRGNRTTLNPRGTRVVLHLIDL